MGNRKNTCDTYHHHAVDALIVAASSQLKLWNKQENPLILDYTEGRQARFRNWGNPRING